MEDSASANDCPKKKKMKIYRPGLLTNGSGWCIIFPNKPKRKSEYSGRNPSQRAAVAGSAAWRYRRNGLSRATRNRRAEVGKTGYTPRYQRSACDGTHEVGA